MKLKEQIYMNGEVWGEEKRGRQETRNEGEHDPSVICTYMETYSESDQCVQSTMHNV